MPSPSKGPEGRRGLSIPQASLLGLLHGPAELLPISSSAHVALVPWLLHWSYEELDAELRKAFEVALHAGTGAALLTAVRGEPGSFDPRLVTLAAVPPALVGLALERTIERHLGTPATIAAGLIAGALAMAVADRAPARRGARDAGVADALWLGVAQACALLPGVSRSGATLAVARRRGFGAKAAAALSRRTGLTVIAGATALKGWRLWRRGLPPGMALPLTAGAGAAFLSTLAARRLIERDGSLTPYAVYRAGLTAAVAGRLIRERSGPCPTIRP